MGWRVRSMALLALVAACSARSPSPTARGGSQAQAADSRPPASAGQDAAVLPCPAFEARHARMLAEADPTCHSDHDCTCVVRPPFLDAKVVVPRAAAAELEAVASAFRAAACPPVTVAQAAAACRPVCRKGRCTNR